VTSWQITDGVIRGFDSQGNFFSDSGFEIGRGDIVTENHTQWTLPNNDRLSGTFAVNSTGNVFFGQLALNGTYKIGTLDHNTSIFTEWSIPNLEDKPYLDIDSSDNLFFVPLDSGSIPISRFTPSTNTFTTWCCVSVSNVWDFRVDQFDNIIIVSPDSKKIIQFNPTTKTITEWPTLSEFNRPYQATVDSNGIIYFTESVPTSIFAIGKLDPDNQTIKEWLLPDYGCCFGGSFHIEVDSSNNVYFAAPSIGRLVPSTDIITIWGLSANGVFEIDSSDTIFWAGSGAGGTVT